MNHFKLLVLLFFCIKFYSQNVEIDSIKQNPIVFGEIYGGIGGSTDGSFLFFGGNINYGFNNTDLISLRFTGFGTQKRENLIIAYVAYPLFVRKNYTYEYAFLYGKRFVYKNKSFSISSGVSINDVYTYDHSESENIYYKNNHINIGIPIELNIKWFKKEKKPFRAYYGVIPTGKRNVSFGRSVGFKLIGNFSKTQYLGLGITYGLGWHKKY